MKKRKIRKITRKKPNRRLSKSRKRTNRTRKTKRKTKTKKPTKKRKRIIIKGGLENMGTQSISIYDQLAIYKDDIHREHDEFVVGDIQKLHKGNIQKLHKTKNYNRKNINNNIGDLEQYKHNLIERLNGIQDFTDKKISDLLNEVISFITGKLNFLLPHMESQKEIIVNNIKGQLDRDGLILYSFTSQKEEYNKLITARYNKVIITLKQKTGNIDRSLEQIKINKQRERNRWENVFNSINDKIVSYKADKENLNISLEIIENNKKALIDLINSV